jgi:hypothetical protein
MWGWGRHDTVVQGLIQDEGKAGIWKLLIGQNPEDGWQGPKFPNSSDFNTKVTDCGPAGCLWRLDTDPTEHHNVVGSEADRAASMMLTIKLMNKTTFSPDRGEGEQDGHITEACDAAIKHYGGFFGPFLNYSSTL